MPRRVTAIVCTRERADLLRETVATLLAGERLPDEVVVVDQSAADGRAPLAALCDEAGIPLVYVHDAGRGLSRARNLAVRAATGDVLAFTDDDMLLDPGWLAAHLDALGADDAVSSGRTPAAAEPGADGFAPSTVDDPTPRTYRGLVPLDVLYPGNMAAPRRVLDRVGAFDERLGAGAAYPSAEDNDYGLRLLRTGGEIRYTPGAVARHRAWRRRRDAVALRRAYGRGQGAFYAKHALRPGGYGLRRAGRDLGRYLPRAVRYATRRSRYDTLGDLAYCGAMLRGMASWWLHRR